MPRQRKYLIYTMILALVTGLMVARMPGAGAVSSPAISSIAPSHGGMAGGTLIVINGSNFQSGATVTINDSAAQSVQVETSRRITALTPASVTSGLKVVVVTNPDTGTYTYNQGFLYDPLVTSVQAPRTGSTVGGSTITVDGSGFQQGLSVWVGENEAAQVTVISGTRLQVVTPGAAPGEVGAQSVTVVNPDGGSATLSKTDVNTFRYEYSNPVFDVLTPVDPAKGSVLGGTRVTLKGTDFDSRATVQFGALTATVLSAVYGSMLVETPQQGSAGTADVSVQNPDGRSADVAGGFEFMVTPTISSVTPNYANVDGTDSNGDPVEITIKGANFDPAGVEVYIGGVTPEYKATDVVVSANGTTIMARVPAGSPGATDLTVINQGSSDQRITLYEGFVYQEAQSQPTINAEDGVPPGIVPNVGSTLGGDEVTISGTQFLTGARVYVGSQQVSQSEVDVRSTTTIVIQTPSGATGPKNVRVVNPDGGEVTVVAGFTYGIPVRITSVTPNEGTVQGGTPLTIKGVNFPYPAQDGDEVTLKIGDIPVMTFVVAAVDTIYAETDQGFIPEGQTSAAYPVTLTFTRTVDGQIRTERSTFTGYSYKIPDSQPAITRVTLTDGAEPAEGPTIGGTTILIDGEDFRSGENLQVKLIERLQQSGAIIATSAIVRGVATVNTGTLDDPVYVNRITAEVPAATRAGPRDVMVVNPDGAMAVLEQAFTYMGTTMAVQYLTPAYGIVTENPEVVIYGANFDEDPGSLQVKVGTVAAGYQQATVMEASATRLKAAFPRHQVGKMDVTISNRYGSVTILQAFTYLLPASSPQITEIHGPSNGDPQGSTTGGTQMTITGENFISGATVKVGDKAATGVTVVSENTITAVSPKGSPGWQPVTVTNPDQVAVTLYDPNNDDMTKRGFQYLSFPTIKSVSPARGSVTGGAIVTIKGTDFYQEGMEVQFGASPVSDENLWFVDSTQVQVRVPAAEAAGTVDVTVTNSDGGTARLALGFEYRLALTTPVIDRVTPNVGPAAGGNQVDITGSDFTADAAVYFGTAKAQVVDVTVNRIRVKAPANQPGLYDVTVINVNDTGVAMQPVGYEYRQSSTFPVITRLSPGQGTVEGDTYVTITGQYFWPGVVVYFGENLAGGAPGADPVASPPVVADSGTTIKAYTPAAKEVDGVPVTGLVDIRVVNPDGGTVTLAGGFKYKIPDSNPEIIAISPSKGSTAGGFPVTIQGTDFRDGLQVYFGGVAAGNVRLVDANTITITAPVHAVGRVELTVVNQDGGVAASLPPAGGFEYRLPASEPAITGITPAEGSVTGGTRVTITGADFRVGADPQNEPDDLPQVMFGTQPATAVERVDYKTITATTPSGAVGLVDVTVINPVQFLGSVTLANAFRYVTTVPAISSVTPNQGRVAGGTRVVITGSGFAEGSDPANVETDRIIVQFGGVDVPYSSITLVDGGTLQVVSPPAAGDLPGPVDVTVVNYDGVQTVRSSGFTYQLPDSVPVVTGVTPATGTKNGGTWVTISGSDLRYGAEIYFGGYPATEVAVVDSSHVRARTPAFPLAEGVSSRAVDVTLANYDGGVGTLAGGFTYKLPLSNPVITAVTPNRGPSSGGTHIIINGQDFRDVTRVEIGGQPATSVVKVDYRTITAVTPAGVEGVREVNVANRDEGSYALAGGFTYFYVQAPVVTTVTPDQGTAAGGTSITISGSKFAQDAQVSIDSEPAVNIQVVDGETITATTPPGSPGWREVRVTNPDGGAGFISSGFYYQRPRTIPPRPGWLSANTEDDSTIHLTFGSSNFAQYYDMFIADDSDGPFRFLAQTAKRSYYATGLQADTRYYFKVRAVNELGASALTSYDYATTDEAESDESAPLSLLRIIPGTGQVNVIIPSSATSSGNYRLDLTGPEYSQSRQWQVTVPARAGRDGLYDLSVSTGGFRLTLAPQALWAPATAHLTTSQLDDAWVRVMVRDAGQAEAEAALRVLPRGARIVSLIYSIGMETQVGRETRPVDLFYGTVNMQIRYRAGDLAQPDGGKLDIYTYQPGERQWVPLGGTVNTYGLTVSADIKQPGYYMLVERP